MCCICIPSIKLVHLLIYIHCNYNYINVCIFFDKLIGCTIVPKCSLFGTTQFTLRQMPQLIMIMMSLTALSLFYLAQDVFLMVHTLNIVEPISLLFVL